MKFPLYPQAHCAKCDVAVGFREQGPAYASADGYWFCERHVDQSWKRYIDEGQAEAQRDAKKRARSSNYG